MLLQTPLRRAFLLFLLLFHLSLFFFLPIFLKLLASESGSLFLFIIFNFLLLLDLHRLFLSLFVDVVRLEGEKPEAWVVVDDVGKSCAFFGISAFVAVATIVVVVIAIVVVVGVGVVVAVVIVVVAINVVVVGFVMASV